MVRTSSKSKGERVVCDQLTRETGVLLKSVGNIGWRDEQPVVLDQKYCGSL